MYSSVLTKIGAAQLLNSQITGTALKWSKMGVGDGGGHTVTPDANKTALVREKYRAGINHLYRDPQDPTQIIAELVMMPEEGGYTIREVGIYDVNDNLVVYGSLPEVVKPVLAEGSGVTLTIRCRATIGNATNIKLIIDPSTVMATRQYVGDVLQKYLPLTGGTLTGNITYNGNSDFSIARYTDTGRTVLRGGTNYNDGASIYLNGKNYSGDVGAPGAMKIIASNGTQSGTLDLSPDGTLTLNGVDIATKQSNVASASKLEMPRKINGKYFDGTQDITITAAADGGTSAACSGNAASADRFKTPRRINGKLFDGTGDITIADDTKLPLSGGTITGDIIIGKNEFSIIKTDAAGRTIIRGGTNYNDGASIYLYGKDFSDSAGSEGDFIILVYNATQNSKFQVSPLGTVKINNKEIPTVDATVKNISSSGNQITVIKGDGATSNFVISDAGKAPMPQVASGVGQFFSSSGTGSSFTLPSGGTWQYIALLQFDNGVFSTGGRGGIGAGGATITLDPQGHSVCRTLCFFWRLA